MTSADEMRASDADRERVVQALQEQVGEGRLTLAEFEERSGEAYQAKTVGELRVLFKDLPHDPLAPPVQPQAPWQQAFPLPAIPPWAQRTFPSYPQQRRPLPPARRGSPLAAVMLVLVGLLVLQGVLAVALHVFFPIIPLVFLLFVLRPRGRRFR
jgi:hypothetical protein